MTTPTRPPRNAVPPSRLLSRAGRSRRRILSAVATAGLGGLAGCMQLLGSSKHRSRDQTSADAVKDVIHRTYVPVCSLTIATDTDPGTLSGSASELATYYERQETVYSPERLNDRLDQFASLLAGL